MKKITFLGTGSGKPSSSRNVSSLLLELNDFNILVDCGEGTQHQFLKIKNKINRIDFIFITHNHGDHIYGLPGLLSSMSAEDRKEPVTLICTKDIKNYLNLCFSITKTYLNFEINYIFIEDSNNFNLDKDTNVKILKNNHDIDSYSFDIISSSTNVDLEKLKSFNIKPGPFLKDLKNNIPYDDGIIKINPEDVLVSSKNNILICGDNNLSLDSELKTYISENQIDTLVHEATILNLEDENILEPHSNLFDILQFLKGKKINKIYLNHISTRYKEEQIELVKEKFNIDNNIQLVKDLENYNL